MTMKATVLRVLKSPALKKHQASDCYWLKPFSVLRALLCALLLFACALRSAWVFWTSAHHWPTGSTAVTRACPSILTTSKSSITLSKCVQSDPGGGGGGESGETENEKMRKSSEKMRKNAGKCGEKKR